MPRNRSNQSAKKASNFAQNVVEGTFDEDLEEAMSEDLRNRSESLPSMKELSALAVKAEQGMTEEDVKSFQAKKEKEEWAQETDTEENSEKAPDATDTEDAIAGTDDENIEDMVNEMTTPVQTTFTKKEATSARPSFKAKDRKPSSADTETYQESFTSQQESAEMRHQIESLDTRLMNMETMFEALLAERKGLPKHLDGYREEMNKQLTIMMDRINTALEKDIPSTSLEQAKGDVQTMTGETDHVFCQLTTDAENNPAKDSATSSAAPITKSRRRVRLIK